MEQFNYLYMAAISLPNETQSQKVLKSFYLTKSKELFGYDRSVSDFINFFLIILIYFIKLFLSFSPET